MFLKVKEYIQTSKKELSGDELYEYLDELKNSKVFKHSKINIIDNPFPRINGKSFLSGNLRIDESFRFFGDIYLYSIGNFMSNPFIINLPSTQNFDSFMIRVIFNSNQQSGFTSDPQKVKKFDRLDQLDLLDI